MAPRGGEALYILVHTPYLRPHHDWKRMFPDYRRTILRKLERTAGLADLESRIVFEAALTPGSFATTSSAHSATRRSHRGSCIAGLAVSANCGSTGANIIVAAKEFPHTD